MPKPVIEIKSLEKEYKGGVKALRGVNLAVREGEIFALLGPNGAGKTTLIGALSGLVKTTGGTATVFGLNVITQSQQVRRKIGVVQQEVNADFFFTVKEIVAIQAGFFGIKRPEKRVQEVLESLSLWDKRDTPGRKLSGGMKRRVMIAKALVHDPEILFLDEPTAGVDVELRENIWALVRDLKKRGKTIILTTHYLEEAEDLADRIGIIQDGKIINIDDTQTMLRRFGRERLCLQLDRDLEKVPPLAKKLGGKLKGRCLEINHFTKSPSDPTVQDLFNELEKLNVKIENLEIKKTSLNDVYLALIKNSNGDGEKS